jgi:hypothetical protein
MDCVVTVFNKEIDLLLIYNDKHTDISITLRDFNNIHPKVYFTMEQKQNFQDITIHRTGYNVTHSIYLNVTARDTIIRSNSCHLIQHKMSVINYMTSHILYEKGRKKHRNGHNKIYITAQVPNK